MTYSDTLIPFDVSMDGVNCENHLLDLNFTAIHQYADVVVFDKDNTLTSPYENQIHPDAARGLQFALEIFGRDRIAIVSNSAGTKDDVEYKDAIAIEESEYTVAIDARRKEIYWARYKDGVRIEGPAVSKPGEVDGFIIDHYPDMKKLVSLATSQNVTEPMYLRRPDAVPTAERT